MTELSCYYSLSSPWAYFGGPKLQDIVRRHHVKLILKPFDFQEVVPRTGGVPLRTRPEPRRTYHALELDRWRKYLGMPLNLVPKHAHFMGHDIAVRTLYDLNPMVRFLESYRALMYDLRYPSFGNILFLLGVSIMTFLIGRAIFLRAEPRFAEEL